MDATGITDLTREKEREFPFSPFLTQGLNQKRIYILAARWLFNIRTGWTVKNYSFSLRWPNTRFSGAKEFVMNILRNLVLRLNYKQDWNLGGLNARNMVQRIQHSILIPHRAMFNRRLKAELQTRLEFRRFKRPKHGAAHTTFNFNTTQSHVQQKAEGPQKPEGSRCSEMHSQPYLRPFFCCAGPSGQSPIIFFHGVRAQLFFSLIIRAQ